MSLTRSVTLRRGADHGGSPEGGIITYGAVTVTFGGDELTNAPPGAGQLLLLGGNGITTLAVGDEYIISKGAS